MTEAEGFSGGLKADTTIYIKRKRLFFKGKPISSSAVWRGTNGGGDFERAKQQQYRIINDEQWQAPIYRSATRAFGGYAHGWRDGGKVREKERLRERSLKGGGEEKSRSRFLRWKI